ncbi:MAG: SGNH/GDSL hydrolase family protein [Gemmatimonadales bacterium]
MQLRLLASGLLLALPLLAGCAEDDDLNAPEVAPENSVFRRYVSMGSSITAGFQSAGINDSTQQRSYAVLIANASGAPFYVPSLQGRGCPAPFVNNVTQVRVGGGGPTDCDLRELEEFPWISNVAVPGATSFSPVNNLSLGANSNALTTFILGGRTQIQAMQDVEPSLVSLWIGNNDVLGALTFGANPGNPALVTPQVAFENNYGQILDAIEATGAEAILITVADVSVIPFASRTAIYYCLTYDDDLRCPAPLPQTPDPNLAGLEALGFWTVNTNCSAAEGGLSTLIPWTKILPRLAAAAAAVPTTLDCDPVAQDTVLVTPTELAGLQGAVVGFNNFIQTQAVARGMDYFDVNIPLAALVADGIIPAVPNLAPALDGDPVTFGPMFSLDGVHPSSEAHGFIADSVAAHLNAAFGTSIPVPVPR